MHDMFMLQKYSAKKRWIVAKENWDRMLYPYKEVMTCYLQMEW